MSALLTGCLLLPCLLILPQKAQASPVQAVVSILPQQFFVQQLAGEQVTVDVMVGPGASPATYDPKPSQLQKLNQARIYFIIGVPFEKKWLPHLRQEYPQLQIVRSHAGIDLRHLKTTPKPGHNQAFDPHIWTDPGRAQTMAANMAAALQKLDPEHAQLYRQRLKRLQQQLQKLDHHIENQLAQLSQRRFGTFHPAWGYFAERYNLQQIALAPLGKQPGPRTLQRTLKQLKDANVRVILVQPQFSKRLPATMGQQIGARILQADPLSPHYMQNMQQIARQLAAALSSAADDS